MVKKCLEVLKRVSGHTLGAPKVLGRLRMVIVRPLRIWCRSEQRAWDYFTNEEEEGEGVRQMDVGKLLDRDLWVGPTLLA